MKNIPMITVASVIVLVIIGTVFANRDDAATPAVGVLPADILENLSREALAGKPAYERSCASCHGVTGEGTAMGPPLLHQYYNPGHHADAAFFRAVRNGVPAHHWRFGDMPKRPEVTVEELPRIVKYVRELQEAAGIFFEPHTM